MPDMAIIVPSVLNGLTTGALYALVALGLTLIYGVLHIINFAHGALFMIGAFCSVTLQRILTLSVETIDETKKDFLGNPLKVKTPYVEQWFGPETGQAIIDWSVPLAILFFLVGAEKLVAVAAPVALLHLVTAATRPQAHLARATLPPLLRSQKESKPSTYLPYPPHLDAELRNRASTHRCRTHIALSSRSSKCLMRIPWSLQE